MDREQFSRFGLSTAFTLGILSSAILAACSGASASSGPGGNQGGSGQPQGGGGGSFGGFGNSGTSGTSGNNAGGALILGGGGPSSTGGTTAPGMPDGGINSVSGPSQPPLIDDCTNGPLSAAQVAQLEKGGSNAGLKLVYPYDGTVFPRGILAPIIQWDQGGTAADGVLVTMTSKKFTYKGCFGATADQRATLPADSAKGNDAWLAAGQYSEGTSDPVTITVTTLASGNVVGPVTETVYFALASLTGAIYYNTYNSTLTNPANVGAVLKILPGQPNQPTAYLTDPMGGGPPFGPCISCHSLSANGAVMTANRHNYTPIVGSFESRSYQVGAMSPTLMMGNLPEAGFSGIYPDGSLIMTNGLADNMSLSAFFPVEPGQPGALDATGTPPSKLVDPKTGMQVTANGWDGVQLHAEMPMFSPDGKHIVYNNYDDGKGHTLYMADFDQPSTTFSNIHKIFEDDMNYAGWPFFTPDSKLVIFTLGDQENFGSQLPNPGTGAIYPDPTAPNAFNAHLMSIDVTTQALTPVPLDTANGYLNGQSYLPAGKDRDNERDFYPTVSPVAAGGFFWVFFTSRRTYGNLQTLDVNDPRTKAIWVTALSIGGTGDTSHPAFYLPGQEFETGNMRAFAALEPCKEDGSACTSGTECCNGFCSGIDPTTHVGSCGIRPPKTCAKAEDACKVDSDCCPTDDAGHPLVCIAGYCSVTSFN